MSKIYKFFICIILSIFCANVSAFQFPGNLKVIQRNAISRVTQSRVINISKQVDKSLKVYGSKPSQNDKGYWEGEWICADCGYVYDRDIDGGGLYFEDLKKGFICPQCSAPRKRYAKKVGETWGITRDGGDWPIYATTVIGLAVTTWLALVYVPTL